MSSRLVSYDPKRLTFVSLKGIEKSVTFIPEDNCDYYLIDNSDFVVKLNKGWINEDDLIGAILSESGECRAGIPHPGKTHGKISTGGLESGDSKGLKLVVVPFGNSESYFLYYNLSKGEFSGAGNTVR